MSDIENEILSESEEDIDQVLSSPTQEETNKELLEDNANALRKIVTESFHDIHEILKSNDAFGEDRIISLLMNFFISTEPFWEKMSMIKDIFSYRFKERVFPSVVYDESTVKEINVDVNKLAEPKSESKEEYLNKIKSKYDLRDLSNKIMELDFIDENAGSKTQPHYRIYERSNYYQIVRQDILEDIFQLAHQKGYFTTMLGLFCALVCSREMCHLIFKERILNLMFNPTLYSKATERSISFENPFLDEKYLEIIHYCLFYGIHLLYKEECTIKSFASLYDRHILSLETVSKLPNYDGPLETNPFVPLTLSKDNLYSEHVPAEQYLIKPLKSSPNDRGLYSIWSFWKRFEIFTDGIFEGLAIDKIYIGGSVINACVIRNPLERLFGIHLPLTDDMIFIARKFEDEEDYPVFQTQREKINAFWEKNKENLLNYFDEHYPSKRILPNDPRLTPSSDQFDISTFLDVEDLLSDIDIKVDVMDDAEFDSYMRMIHLTIKHNLEKRLGRKLMPNELSVIKICTQKSYKYYISGSAISRSIEIFRMFWMQPIGGVGRYHFPCVRGIAIPGPNLYDGQVYVHPSLMCAAMSGIYADYKWMANGESTKNLILKYFLRGGILLLNAHEHADLSNFIDNNPAKWGIIRKMSNPAEPYYSINNPIFKPRNEITGVFYDLQKKLSVPFNDLKSKHYQHILDDPHFERKWKGESQTTNQKSESRYGYDLSLRYPSGHLKPVVFWKVLSYIHSLKVSKENSL